MHEFLTTPAAPVNGQRGTTDTALLVRYPNGSILPLGIECGRTASEFLDMFTDMPDYVITAVRRHGISVLL